MGSASANWLRPRASGVDGRDILHAGSEAQGLGDSDFANRIDQFILRFAKAGEMPAKRMAIYEAAIGWLSRDVRPRIILAADRSVIWCNQSAEVMLDDRYPVWLQDGSLKMSSVLATGSFDAYLTSLGQAVRRFLIREETYERGMLVSGWGAGSGTEAIKFLEFVVRSLPLDARTSGMTEQFGLTPSESDVIDCLAEMMAPKIIAQKMAVSVHTVRTHIRNIHQKLEVSSQAQLTRTILAYCSG